MTALAWLALALAAPPASPPDTIRLEVGSAEVDGRVFPVHRARNRVYLGDGAEPVTQWTNELALGDSAGRPVMRWTTRGVQRAPDGRETTWELLQTYDARSLAPLSYLRTTSGGALLRLRFEAGRVSGVQRLAGSPEERPYERRLDRAGFIASATDLVPMAVGLKAGAVMTAPVWGPGMEAAEERVFSVLRQEPVEVEGEVVTAWRVEERSAGDGRLLATWWLTESSPYMVYAEVALADGRVQRITGVALPD